MAKEWRLLDLYVDLNENSAFLNPALQRARMERLVPDTVAFCCIKKSGFPWGFIPIRRRTLTWITAGLMTSRKPPLAALLRQHRYPGFFVAYIIVGKNFMPPRWRRFSRTVISRMAEEFNSRWGTSAEYRPFNDMEVGGRKVSWMGGSFFGDVWSGASVLLIKPSPWTGSTRP